MQTRKAASTAKHNARFSVDGSVPCIITQFYHHVTRVIVYAAVYLLLRALLVAPAKHYAKHAC
jgi:hypothetical protein